MEKSEDFLRVVVDIKQLEEHMLSLDEDTNKNTSMEIKCKERWKSTSQGV